MGTDKNFEREHREEREKDPEQNLGMPTQLEGLMRMIIWQKRLQERQCHKKEGRRECPEGEGVRHCQIPQKYDEG